MSLDLKVSTLLKINSLLFLFLLSFASLRAQKLNPAPMIAGVESDINYLTSGYLSPLGDAMTRSMGDGWYHNGGCDGWGCLGISIRPNFTFIPDKSTTFRIDPSQLQELELVDPNDDITPTAFGPQEEGVALEYSNSSLPAGLGDKEFNMPSGYGFQTLPTFQIQAAVGLPGHFTARVRYLPEITIPGFEDTRYQLYGAALQNKISEWMPGLKQLPLDISLLGGYTYFSLEQPLPDGKEEEQKLSLATEAWTGRLVISKEFSFLTTYIGIGYNGGSTRIQMQGTYNYINPLEPSNPEQTIEDPVDFTTEGGTGVVANAGFQLRFLKVVYFAAGYNTGKYSSANASLGMQLEL